MEAAAEDLAGDPKGRIDLGGVEAEIARLKRAWVHGEEAGDGLETILSPEQLKALDAFDRMQLAHVVETCSNSRSMSDAGRTLFAALRSRRTSSNEPIGCANISPDLSWADISSVRSRPARAVERIRDF